MVFRELENTFFFFSHDTLFLPPDPDSSSRKDFLAVPRCVME